MSISTMDSEQRYDNASSSYVSQNSNNMSDTVDYGINFDEYFNNRVFANRNSTLGTSHANSRGVASVLKKPNNEPNRSKMQAEESNGLLEPLRHVRYNSLNKLKDSTKQLLALIENIQQKTDLRVDGSWKPTQCFTESPKLDTGSHQFGTKHFTNCLDNEDECTIYHRLTRRCHCLDRKEYNDFIIHFNENTRYFTSSLGEIMKNVRILKKFLYIGGGYTKNALIFFNEGLADSSHSEKLDIVQGISYADVCNVFEEHSIVIVCILWPTKYESLGDEISQGLAASFLYKLVQLEEGRRYLNHNSKITNDIKKVLKKSSSKLNLDTLESLHAVLEFLHPTIDQFYKVAYCCKNIVEGFGERTLNALSLHREYMTVGEIMTHLDLLYNLSCKESGKKEILLILPALLSLFKGLLREYDNSEMNILITNVLNNVMSKNMLIDNDSPHAMVFVDTATETIKMKNESSQMPPKKNHSKKFNKSKLILDVLSTKIKHQPQRKDESRNPIILVPLQKPK